MNNNNCFILRMAFGIIFIIFNNIIQYNKTEIIIIISAATHATTRLTLAQHCPLAKTKPIARAVVVVPSFSFCFSFVFSVLHM